MTDSKKPTSNTKTTLSDDEIKTERPITRRSLFGLVAGIAGAGVASCVPAGQPGRGYVTPQPTAVYTGITDGDTGQFQDQAGYGRGTGAYTGISDNDAGQFQDQAGYGRGTGTYTGLSDNDAGQFQDQAGYGRGTTTSGYTGLTDSDSGTYQDTTGYGRRGW